MAGTNQWSCWVCHLGGMALLIAMGCMNCILAPASTLGMDFVPHPDAADEPLFSNLPVPSEDLYAFAIGRDPPRLQEERLPKEALETKQSFVRSSLVMQFSNELDVDEFLSAAEKTTYKKSKSDEMDLELAPMKEDLRDVDVGLDATEPIQGSDDGEATPTTSEVDEEEGRKEEIKDKNDKTEDEDEALAVFSTELKAACHSQEINIEEEEAELAAAWAKLEAKLGGTGNATASSKAVVKSASQAWGSGGTGRRGSYSSVRTPAEAAEHRSSYLELQRPDLDRRTSHRASVNASLRASQQQMQQHQQPQQQRDSHRGSLRGTATARRSSDLFRNR